MNLETIEMKAFVPARDLAESIAFYEALGFGVSMESDDLAYIHHGKTAFLLSQFYLREHAENFVMHLLVANADDWHRNVEASGVVGRFSVRVSPPDDRPWGLRDFTLIDPTGVLWRIGHVIPDR
ncbi:VOC family protein [Pseudoxanthomonas sp. LjRoot143]|uniref:VOC family protein n=1 Tax=unclassified Pseudoxanthomonas TaxID=2645906 RepID=UPI00177F8DBC|nr:VOC family protein [Pseudoxanthomonas sp. PXM01]MBD9471069.1 VOC family protein [Pseudoxanthomonas sp. PXM01]